MSSMCRNLVLAITVALAHVCPASGVDISDTSCALPLRCFLQAASSDLARGDAAAAKPLLGGRTIGRHARGPWWDPHVPLDPGTALHSGYALGIRAANCYGVQSGAFACDSTAVPMAATHWQLHMAAWYLDAYSSGQAAGRSACYPHGEPPARQTAQLSKGMAPGHASDAEGS
eukprot:5221306-Amphidinium_carterae.2